MYILNILLGFIHLLTILSYKEIKQLLQETSIVVFIIFSSHFCFPYNIYEGKRTRVNIKINFLKACMALDIRINQDQNLLLAMKDVYMFYLKRTEGRRPKW